MNDEAESSGAAQRRTDGPRELAEVEADTEDAIAQIDDEEVQRLKEQLVKERRLDAKRKRIRMLNELLRELDLAVYMQLIAVYHLEYDTTAPPLHPTWTWTNQPATAARSSGSPSRPSSTAACSPPCPTRLVNVRPTSLSRSCP
jgi:hypothetical protein